MRFSSSDLVIPQRFSSALRRLSFRFPRPSLTPLALALASPELTRFLAQIAVQLDCLSGFGHHQALKLRHCGFFGDALDQREFSGQAIKRGSVQLAFAVALFGIDGPSAEIAHYFRYRDDVAGFDLGFIFFFQSKPAGPNSRSRLQQGLSN